MASADVDVDRDPSVLAQPKAGGRVIKAHLKQKADSAAEQAFGGNEKLRVRQRGVGALHHRFADLKAWQ